MRDIILPNSAVMGPCDAGYYSAKFGSNGARVMRDIILQNSAVMGPCDAGYYSAKFGSNGQ
jgi:hypothetical protein